MSASQQGSSASATPDPQRLLFLAALALVFVYTLAPFDFISASMTVLPGRAAAALDIRATGGLLKMGGHFAAFAALGALASAAHRRRFLGYGKVRVLATAAIGCAGLEFTQLLHEYRHARVTDFLVNLAGACVGASVVTGLSAPGIGWEAPKAWSRGAQLAIYGAVLGLATTVWYAAGMQPVAGGLSLGWDDHYPLLIGAEADGTRAWSGETGYVAVYNQPLSDAQVSELYRSLTNLTARDEERYGLLAGYDLARARRCALQPEGSLDSTEHLVLRATRNCDPEAEGDIVSAGASFISDGSAAALTHAVASSEGFSVEAWIRPADIIQRGHLRIVSLSDGGAHRNFTLAQTGEGFVFRVRNAITGLNATYYPLVAPAAARTEWQHVLAVYDRGVSLLYVDGHRLPDRVNLRQPTVFLGIGSDLRAAAAGGSLLAILLALPMLGLLRGWTPSGSIHAIVLPVVIVLSSAPYIAACTSCHPIWDLERVAASALGLVVVYPPAVLYTTGGFL